MRCLIAGSAARGGFLADRVDIDLFLLFPPELSRESLERDGLALARAVLPAHEMRYAEHPYLRGDFEGFRVDAVPGYAVPSGARPQSAVDRTPFHQAYLAERESPELIDQIRLTKQFLRSLGVYGSEARTAGFSGYLVELLVLRFGSFAGLVGAAADWRIPVRLGGAEATPPRVPESAALTLADPVDPERNVSSALSRSNLARFILAARAYRARPTERAFDPTDPPKETRTAAVHRRAARGTHVATLRWDRPDLVDDVLYPQLRRAERGIVEAADRLGFQPLGSGVGADERALVIVLEVAQARLPAVRLREGPPVGLDRSGSFLDKWAGRPEVVQGPYVRADGHLAVETERAERSLEPLLALELPQVPLGPDLRRPTAPAEIRALEEAEPGPALELALGELFGKSLPEWMRPPTAAGAAPPGPS